MLSLKEASSELAAELMALLLPFPSVRDFLLQDVHPLIPLTCIHETVEPDSPGAAGRSAMHALACKQPRRKARGGKQTDTPRHSWAQARAASAASGVPSYPPPYPTHFHWRFVAREMCYTKHAACRRQGHADMGAAPACIPASIALCICSAGPLVMCCMCFKPKTLNPRLIMCRMCLPLVMYTLSPQHLGKRSPEHQRHQMCRAHVLHQRPSLLLHACTCMLALPHLGTQGVGERPSAEREGESLELRP
jgi:hypothetical protein